jgi:hypothetical protein
VIARVRTVDAMVSRIGASDAIRKADLEAGDRILVVTQNSTYTIHVLGGGAYSITGGWFDRQGLSPIRLSIAGCTWGGAAIRRDIVAAPGLRIEFSNRVLTTPIRRARLLRPGMERMLRPVQAAELFDVCYRGDAHRT